MARILQPCSLEVMKQMAGSEAGQRPLTPHDDPRDDNPTRPGDTDSGDIVGPTGEQMPHQAHDGLDTDERDGGPPSEGEAQGAPPAADPERSTVPPETKHRRG